MKQFLLFMAFVLSIAFISCQKEQLPTTVSTDLTDGFVADRDSHGHHHGGGHHGHAHDSLKPKHHHHHDSTHVHGNHDSTHVHGGGHHGNHPHDSTHVNPTPCQSSVETIVLADLPAAAQAWLAANKPNAVIVSIKKVTRKNCEVRYEVKIEGEHKRVRFDADGKKVGG